MSILTFSYIYDSQGRLSSKTVPGNITINIIYDPMNRPVLMQDANMAANHQWNYIKYDIKGRAISQGIYTDATHTTASTMQTYVTGLSYATWYEGKNGVSTTGYYTNSVFPTTSIAPLAYSFYDNYDLLNNGTVHYPYSPSGLTGDNGATTAQIKGMPTMVMKSTVGTGMTTTWLMSVQFYDHNLRTIQSQSNNLLYTTPGPTVITDYKTVVPDFVGMPTVSKVTIASSSTVTTTVQTTVTYDHVHRVTAVDQNYNLGATVHVAAYSYNELGQATQKKLGTNGAGWLQLVDFRYNIRGQLTNINNSTLTNDGQTDDDPAPVFGMQLLYDKTDPNLSYTPYKNGRLSAVKWMSKDGSGVNSKERAFTYNYDAVGRYTAANYAERTGTGAFSFTHGWDEQVTGYDENGNIKTLTRNATTQGSNSYTPVDNLTYTYSGTNANQLASVSDATGSNVGFMGGTGTYTYDANGNLTNEPYKGLSHIYYNTLNKTDKITFTSSANRYIYYIYDATGNILEKQQYDNVSGVATLIHKTDYMDGFVYLDGALSYFATAEGRVTYAAGTFTNEYIISDQQGNARVSFNNTGPSGAAKVVQENSYYGFGMVMPGSVVTGGNNKNLYNGGNEWQNDYSNLPDYYQTFYRNYDAAIGRFVGVDPMPESAESMSNYQYAGNNPVMMNDPMGNAAASQTQTESHELYSGWYGTSCNSIFGNQDLAQGGGGDWAAIANAAANDKYTAAQGWDGSEMQYMAALAASTNLFDAGNAATGTPETGNAANALAAAKALTGASGSSGGVAIYFGNDGSIDYRFGSRNNYIVNQKANNTWVFNAMGDGNQGGGSDQFDLDAKAAGITMFPYIKSQRSNGVVLKFGITNGKRYDTNHFKFVQVVKQNEGGKESIFIDYTPSEHVFPFFYNDDEERQNGYRPGLGGFDGSFFDEPHRDKISNGDSWSGTLFIIQTTAGGNNNVIFTIHYGWSISNGQVNPYPLTDKP